MTSDYSALDIVAFYIDFGRDYAPLFESMTRSAKEHMPDCRTILLSPNPPDNIVRHFDGLVTIGDAEVNTNTLCLTRGRTHLSWMTKTDRPAVLVDPDIIFRKPVPLDRDCDVGLNWRDKPDQPINSGAVFARPGCPEFWAHYGRVCVNVPKKLWAWWCDQLAFSLMTGVCHRPGEVLKLDDARVALWDALENCSTAEFVSEKAWAIHNKGRRKGPGWEHVFTGEGGNLPVGVLHAGAVET